MSNPTLDVVKSLRTIHMDFNDRIVSDEDVETIIEQSMRTANSDNLTDYSIIVVDDPEVLNTISGGESGGKKLKCLIYCLDHTRIIKAAEYMGYTNFKPATALYNFNIAMYDVHAAAQTAVIAAKSLGIDSLVTNFIHRHHPKETMSLLNLPSTYCIPLITVVLGYSDKKVEETTGRLSKKHVVHYGKYRPIEDINVDEIVEEMDKIYPGYISEKYQHSLDWYFNEWMIEHYEESVYKELYDAYCDAKLMFFR